MLMHCTLIRTLLTCLIRKVQLHWTQTLHIRVLILFNDYPLRLNSLARLPFRVLM